MTHRPDKLLIWQVKEIKSMTKHKLINELLRLKEIRDLIPGTNGLSSIGKDKLLLVTKFLKEKTS